MRQIYFIKAAELSWRKFAKHAVCSYVLLTLRELPQFIDSRLPLTRSFFRVIRLSLYGLLLLLFLQQETETEK
jgi:hypothetical protein